jgi:hypothetical protein
MNFTVDNTLRNNNIENINTNSRFNNNRAGSGRLNAKQLALKTHPSFSSLDETTNGNSWRDYNNNQQRYFRRTSSTNCLQELPKSQLYGNRFGASREA